MGKLPIKIVFFATKFDYFDTVSGKNPSHILNTKLYNAVGIFFKSNILSNFYEITTVRVIYRIHG